MKGGVKSRRSFLHFRCADGLLDPAEMGLVNVSVHSRAGTLMTEGSDPDKCTFAQDRPSGVALQPTDVHVGFTQAQLRQLGQVAHTLPCRCPPSPTRHISSPW